MALSSTTQEKRNWQIHLLYVRHEFDECLALIEAQLKDNKFSEYAIYVKGSRLELMVLRSVVFQCELTANLWQH
jgi:hypothetical protein